jgi:vancomycin resistance protein YoaR
MKIFKYAITFFLFFFSTNTAFAEDVLLAEYETSYETWGKNNPRAHNIVTAASKISHVVLQPNESFSFNERVGKRTKLNGFKKANMISNGRLKKAFGGGVCQVSGTLHAAVLHAGLEILEHHNHSRMSSYIGLGLDATVSWSTKDFIFENPYPFEITIKISHPDDGKINVSIFGKEKFGTKVMITSKKTKSFKTVFVYDKNLPPGKEVLQESGTHGYWVTVKRISSNYENFEIDMKGLVYSPSNRVIRRGPIP